MKRHLLTAALAIVALGGAVASTAKINNNVNLDDLYYDENCNEVFCGEYLTEECKSIVLYDECSGIPVVDPSGFIRP